MSILAGLSSLLVWAILPALQTLALLAILFTALQHWFAPCNATPPWWRKPGLVGDISFALIPRLLYGYVQAATLVFGIGVFYGLTGESQVAGFFHDGIGPLAGLPHWLQAALYLLGFDLVLYGTHRAFHTNRLWPFHALHHYPAQLEWISFYRFHPVDHILHNGLADTAMLLLGVSPAVVVWLAPFNAATSALAHANLDWDFGPFRHVLASPVYHRWHHTSAARGGRSNFAATFPILDRAFGTQSMPRDERPDGYGVDDAGYPAHLVQQLLHPFRRRRRLSADAPPGHESRGEA